MKAYNLHGVNDLRYEEVEIPKLISGWALVEVKAAGICSSDIPRIFKKGTYHFPTIPGHEFSGVVKEVADDDDRSWIGKKIGIFPLIPCKICDSCKKRHYEMCSDYDYVGSRRDGGFAEYVAVPVWNLVELPDNVTFEVAAMLEPLSVALHAVKQTTIGENDKVAIIGTGMIAFAAAQWAYKFAKTQVTIIGRNMNKSGIAEKIEGIDYKLIDDITEEYDVVIEAVGSVASIDKSINIVKPGGNLVLMGNPEGDIKLVQNTYWRILRKQLHIVGTWNSAYECGEPCDWTEVIDSLKNNEINVEHLITHKFTQVEAENGMKLMLEHKEPYCKVMTLWNR